MLTRTAIAIISTVFLLILIVFGSDAIAGAVESLAEWVKETVLKVPFLSLPIERRVTLHAEFDEPFTYEFKDPVEQMSVYFSTPNADFLVGDGKIGNEGQVNVTLFKWRGSLQVNMSPLVIDLDGKVAEAVINGVSLQSVKHLDIESKGLKAEKVEIEGIKVKRFQSDVHGSSTLQDRISIELDGEKLILEAFLGDIKLEQDKAKFSGFVKRMRLISDNFTFAIS